MNKYLKYSLVGIGSLVGLVLLLAVSIPFLFENRIKSIFISSLNNHLATEVVVDENDIQLSILKTFPYASVSFKNIGIRESITGSDAFFLTASEISLAFNVRDIIRKKYDVNQLIIRNAQLHLIEDAEGNVNYRFWKPATGETQTEFNINLKKIIIENTEFTYLDEGDLIDLNLLIHKANATGNFSSESFSVKTKADVLSRHINVNKEAYLTAREVNLDCVLAVNTKSDTYTFSKSFVVIDKNKFGITGDFTIDKGTDYNLQFDGRNVNLEALMISMPASYANALKGLQSKGNLTFQANVEGKYSATSRPATNIRFDLQKGTLNHAQFNDKLTDVVFNGSYSNGSQHNRTTSSVQLKNFTAKYKGENISGNFQLLNFNNPEIDFDLNGIVPAALIIPLLDTSITDVTGQIQFEHLQFKGNMKALKQNGISQNPPSGKALISDVAFTYNNEPIKIPAAEIIVSNTEMQLHNFSITLPGADFMGDLSLGNWLSIIGSADISNIIPVSGKITSSKLDIKQLQTFFTTNTKKGTSPQSAIAKNSTPLWMQLSGPVEVEIKELTYGTFILQNLSSTLRCSPSLLAARNISANTQNGTAQLSATFRLTPSGNYMLETSGVLNSIDISEMFKQLNNFGQTTLTHENISGKATLLVENITIGFDRKYRVIEQSIYALSDVKIEQGELKDYKPLLSLSNFVDINDLKHIRFQTLQNQIEIKDRTIFIPATFIQSSALDLYLSGTHTFDNRIDYQLKLSMADVMMNKFFKSNKSENDYEKAEGGINVYLTMKGTVEKPVIEFNKKEGKKKLEQSGLDEPDFLDIFKPDANEQDNKKVKQKSDTNKPEDTDEPIEYIDWEDD